MSKKRRGRFFIPFRRKREGRTDYRLRYRLLKSGKPLFIVRRSLRYIYVSISIPEEGGDRTLFTISSKILNKKYNWVGLKNTPAAYLTGLIAGKKALKMGIKDAILNLGYAFSKKATIPFAAVTGANDAGMNIPIGGEALVDEYRLKGGHIADYARLLKKADENKFKRQFSQYIKNNFDPLTIPDRFMEVREKILGDCDG